MTLPGRVETARLLLSLDPPEWFLRHACAVADIAAWLAVRARDLGAIVDPSAVESAALLHDVDKLPSAGADGRLRHGEGSAAWLEAHDLAPLAVLVRDHPVTHLADDALVARLAGAPVGARLVAYADKRAGQHLESMEERFASWGRRYPSGPGAHVLSRGRDPRNDGWSDEVAALVAARAQALEREACALAGTAPEHVQRLRWSRRALRAASAGPES